MQNHKESVKTSFIFAPTACFDDYEYEKLANKPQRCSISEYDGIINIFCQLMHIIQVPIWHLLFVNFAPYSPFISKEL